jgi:hypothetical protein
MIFNTEKNSWAAIQLKWSGKKLTLLNLDMHMYTFVLGKLRKNINFSTGLYVTLFFMDNLSSLYVAGKGFDYIR